MLLRRRSQESPSTVPTAKMPSSDYGNAVGGGLKLKGGAKDAGVKKHKKKKTAKVLPEVDENGEKTQDLAVVAKDGTEEDGIEPPAVDEGKVARELAAEVRELGKTEAQRRHEERKRKRVSSLVYIAVLLRNVIADSDACIKLDERLQREGVKTHKERVEELNRYLSNLSEHHDM